MKRKTICFLAALPAVICVICGVGLWKIGMEGTSKISGESTMEPVADWFSAYSGEKVQRVISVDGDVYSPARCNDVIFYRADEAESLNTIIAEIKKEILEPLMSDTQTRPFTVTAYNVDEQNQIFHLPLLQDSLEEPDVPQWIQDYGCAFGRRSIERRDGSFCSTGLRGRISIYTGTPRKCLSFAESRKIKGFAVSILSRVHSDITRPFYMKRLSYQETVEISRYKSVVMYTVQTELR